MENDQSRRDFAMVHFCSSEVGLLTNDPSMTFVGAREGMRALVSVGDRSWRTDIMKNSLCLAHIMIGQYNKQWNMQNRL